MESLIQFFSAAAFFSLVFTLPLTLGQMARDVRRRRLLLTGLSCAVLLLAVLANESEHPLFLIVAALGFAVGRARSLAPTTLRRFYVASPTPSCVIVGSFCDLLLDSGFARFGLPSFHALVDPQLAASVLFYSLVGSVVTAVGFLVVHLVARGVVAPFARKLGPSRASFFSVMIAAVAIGCNPSSALGGGAPPCQRPARLSFGRTEFRVYAVWACLKAELRTHDALHHETRLAQDCHDSCVLVFQSNYSGFRQTA